ncbi:MULTISPECIES: DNA-directed RNA polymerase subunit omega [Bacillus cereus group]|uniref:DNA-directed RNA polymerase subunit omega n=1 Tax=Bacillus cereus group TaxID=86661 RepID=UPI0022E70558|nr:DNA-directed RNA polymerase subunit omega [Bacillus cereus group sp. TH152-1LC]MDA1674544.1 DNA-directed RNA polymerase subunit omega [Bacillus cereus group sp. TH152-1LC]
MSEFNRYELVHLIAQRAKEKEIRGRNPLQQEDYMPTINKIKERKNFVKEAHDEILQELKNGTFKINRETLQENTKIEK